MIYVCVVKAHNTFYLLTHNDGAVMASEEKGPLLNYWTGGWERGLSMAVGLRTAACLSYIQLSPSVFQVEGEDELRQIIGREEPYDLLRISSTGGWFDGIECSGPEAESKWEKGERPIFFRPEVVDDLIKQRGCDSGV